MYGIDTFYVVSRDWSYGTLNLYSVCFSSIYYSSSYLITHQYINEEKIMAASEDFIDTFYHSIGDLHSVRESLNKEYSAGLKKIPKRATKDIEHIQSHW